VFLPIVGWLSTDYTPSYLKGQNCSMFVPSSLILLTLMMETIRSSETSVLTRATRRHIAEGDILQSQP
jgi:hypothetical protein